MMYLPVRKLGKNIITSIREAICKERHILRMLRVKRDGDKEYPKITDVGEVPLTYLIFKHLLKRREPRSLNILNPRTERLLPEVHQTPWRP
jgi:hypothetical protein